jgi:hypothetical protein
MTRLSRSGRDVARRLSTKAVDNFVDVAVPAVLRRVRKASIFALVIF